MIHGYVIYKNYYLCFEFLIVQCNILKPQWNSLLWTPGLKVAIKTLMQPINITLMFTKFYGVAYILLWPHKRKNTILEIKDNINFVITHDLWFASLITLKWWRILWLFVNIIHDEISFKVMCKKPISYPRWRAWWAHNM